MKATRCRPFGVFEITMALRYLRSKKGDGYISFITWVSFIGIMLGVAVLIVVTSVMNGFRQELLKKMMGVNGHIVVYAPGASPISGFEELTRKIREVGGVSLAIPYIEAQVLLTTEKVSVGANVRAMTEKDFVSFFRRSHIETCGRDLSQVASAMDFVGKPTIETKGDLSQTPGIVIGKGIARALGVGYNDFITVMYPHGAVTPFGMAPRLRRFPVVGLFEVGMSEYDRAFAFINFRDAGVLFNMVDRGTKEPHVTAIEVFLQDVAETSAVARKLLQILPSGYQVLTWQVANKTFFEALQVERNVMFLILTLILVVASFNIVSGLVMLVQDKVVDIAILRAIGASRASVARIFLIMGSSIGLIGTALGTAIGLLFSLNVENLRTFVSWLLGVELFSPEIYFLSHLPSQVDARELGGIVLLSASFSFLATIYPSWRAASMEPTEVLRYD